MLTRCRRFFHERAVPGKPSSNIASCRYRKGGKVAPLAEPAPAKTQSAAMVIEDIPKE
jgi:hypothetical protein